VWYFECRLVPTTLPAFGEVIMTCLVECSRRVTSLARSEVATVERVSPADVDVWHRRQFRHSFHASKVAVIVAIGYQVRRGSFVRVTVLNHTLACQMVARRVKLDVGDLALTYCRAALVKVPRSRHRSRLAGIPSSFWGGPGFVGSSVARHWAIQAMLIAGVVALSLARFRLMQTVETVISVTTSRCFPVGIRRVFLAMLRLLARS